MYKNRINKIVFSILMLKQEKNLINVKASFTMFVVELDILIDRFNFSDYP